MAHLTKRKRGGRCKVVDNNKKKQPKSCRVLIAHCLNHTFTERTLNDTPIRAPRNKLPTQKKRGNIRKKIKDDIRKADDLKAEIKPHMPAATALFHVDSFIGDVGASAAYAPAGTLIISRSTKAARELIRMIGYSAPLKRTESRIFLIQYH